MKLLTMCTHSHPALSFNYILDIKVPKIAYNKNNHQLASYGDTFYKIKSFSFDMEDDENSIGGLTITGEISEMIEEVV